MDLCVSCKGCKRDCPTGVDMARMKIEVKSARRMSKGLGLRDRLIGDLPAMAPWARRLPWLFNLAGVRAVLISASPSSARCRSGAATRSSPRPTSMQRDATVVIFADTFSNNFEPEILHAARRVLEAAGHRVAVAWPDTRRARRCAAAAPISRPARSTRHATRRARLLRGAGAVRGAGRAGGRAGAVVPVHPARRIPGAWASARRRKAARQCLPVRGIPGAREEGGAAQARAQAAGRRRPRCCTAIATRRRSAP